MKKIIALLLALVMVLSLAVTALAEETTYSITINNSTKGHTYEAYQIFTGDLVENGGSKILSNIVWGSGVSEAGRTALGDAAAKAETLKKESDAKTFAKTVADYLTTPAGSANTVTDGNYVISGLKAGYYLVKDKDGSLTGKPDAYTDYIVKVVGDVTADPKSSVPTVEKKVKDINDSTDTSKTGWQDSADYDIGDLVPFQLKATLAGNVSSYTTYKVVFHDTLSAGLTYKGDAKVYLDGKDVTSYFTINISEDKKTLTITCDNVKAFNAVDNSVITVEYTAALNENAVIGSAGNPNTVYLEYSNNPNKSETGDNETGNTPIDTVIVFTYKTIINKVKSDNTALTGAAFKLEKKIKGGDDAKDTWTLVKKFTVDDKNPASTFEFKGLDDGIYKLTETVTPAGYNSIDPITFSVTAEHSNGDAPELTSLNGEKVTGEITFTSDITKGSLTSDVVNNSGAELPSTGGRGTTIFYVVGGILVLVAAVLLITRKRMSNTEE